MNLVIHDLPQEIWESVAPRYVGCHVLGPSPDIKPCTGCFGCWLKTPGRCVLKDGFDCIAPWFCEASEVTIISRCTFGGFSWFVKSCLDRCSGCALPLFEVDHGEMLHRARFVGAKDMRFRFWGRDIPQEERELAMTYARCVARSWRTQCRSIDFDDFVIESPDKTANAIPVEPDKTVMVNFSLRNERSNTGTFLGILAKHLPWSIPVYPLHDYVDKQDALVNILLSSSRIVLGMPMYVDGIPASAIRILERLQNTVCDCPKQIYALTDRGMFESQQLRILMAMIKTWCQHSGHRYCGGLAISAAEMQGQLIRHLPMNAGPLKYVGEGLINLAEAIALGTTIDNIYAEPAYASRFLYVFMANRGWMKTARQNGVTRKELFRAEDDESLY